MKKTSSPYTITGTLHEGQRTTLLRAVRDADGRPVILKVLDPRRSRPRDIERLKHEHEIGKMLDSGTSVTPLALEAHEGRTALVMEDFGGESLDHLLGAPMDAERFLELAVRIAAAVAQLHQREIIHRDLKPQNILVNAATGQVKLIDFGLASRLPREHQASASPSLIEGSLPYLSPEQTGRMNRAIDSRADLYALGVTFYELLTGRLPFEARDPLEWVHCHVARAPPPPSAFVPELPEVLSAIVLKLLAKMAENRYQTARGLQHDLERCLTEWQVTGRIEPFPLAQHDVSGRFQIPQKLYGREDEVTALLSAFERVVGTGSPELVLVSGYSGIGKSALVHELHKPIVRERGFFISGKFDQHKRDIPYSTIVQAFRELVLELLAGSEERLAAFRERLLGALGKSGQLLVDVIPQVELVIGRQPPIAELPPTDAQNRFRVVFRQFIGVFTRKEHPLALFLDDLQWADPASLKLLEDLMTHSETRYLLVIGAYRDNEVTPSHPLMLTLDEARKEGARVWDIVLGPLSREHLAALVSDTLHCRHEDAAPLSDLIHEKTAGNPFFAIQFLTALHEERLIEFDGHAEAWRWDVAKIRQKGFTDNVVALMVGKLMQLPASTQEALKQLACLGNTAEIAILAMVHGCSEEVSHAALWEAARAGLVLRMDGTYKFLHDRVQEAAYSLIPEDERAAVHLEIGRLLSSRTPPEELEEKIFEIVDQQNRGAALITSREERERVAELNLIAGKRAKKATAYASALNYLAVGSELLGGESWDRRYELTFATELHLAECEIVTGNPAAAEERLSTLWRRARDLVDAGAVAYTRVDHFTTQTWSDRAVGACLDYLRRVGVAWSPHPTDEEVQREYERLWELLGSRSIEELIDLPPMTDPVWRATVDVLAASIPAALFTDANLLALILGRAVNLSLAHGYSDASCLTYVYLSTCLGPRFGDYQAAFRFGKLGFDLVEKYGLPRFKARVYATFAYTALPWTRHLRESIELMRRARDAAQETGDLLYVGYTGCCLVSFQLAAGHPLGEVQREAEDALEFARRARFHLIVDVYTGNRRLIRTLRGLSLDFSTFNDAEFDEGRFEQRVMGDPALTIAACWYWIRKLQARFYAGDHASAIEAASKAEQLLQSSAAFFEAAEYHFYSALARAARHVPHVPHVEDVASDGERPRQLTALAAHHKQLEVWAENCPENFGDRAALVGAEIARIERRDLDAERLYEEAIRSASDSGFVHNEALAYELASRFYRARGFDKFADTYLLDARACYARWGADGKVKQIDRQNPRLVEPRALTPAATFAARPEQLDLLSVTKASQTISGEILLDKLLRTLLEVVLEQGGAQKAYLLLFQDGSLSIEAEAALEAEGAGGVSTLEPGPVDSSQSVPMSLVQYVQRTKERVILGDASADAGKFSGDDYFARVRPKSVLCMPILRQGEVVGLLYLENNLLAGAFTLDRLATLQLLATQAAISLEYARLLSKERAARAAAEDAERRAQQAIHVRDEFLSVAAHELNTPMTSLSLSLESLDRTLRAGRSCDPQTLGRLVERALRQATRLTRLNSELLDVSRIHADRLPLELDDVDLGEVVGDVIAAFKLDLARAGCSVSVEGGGRVAGLWDRSRVDQIVTNLLANAIKFGAGKPIEIFVGEEGGTARLAVRDHGIGIDPAQQEQIFERFERAVSDRHYGGLGLGLYISRKLAEAHGGVIRVQSAPGAGATFTVELPCAGPPQSVDPGSLRA